MLGTVIVATGLGGSHTGSEAQGGKDWNEDEAGMEFHKVMVRGRVWLRVQRRWAAKGHGMALNPPREELDDDKVAGTAADVMIAGTEAVAATADQRNNEKKVHGGMKAARLLR
jgi:hypothetical protein